MPPPYEWNKGAVKNKPWQLKRKIIEQRKMDKLLKLFNEIMMETTQSTRAPNSQQLGNIEINWATKDFRDLIAQLECIARDTSFD